MGRNRNFVSYYLTRLLCRTFRSDRKVLAGNLFQTDTKVEAGINKIEFVTLYFAGVEVGSISESASLS